ncbi:MAG: cysteine hydrolase [Actinomycetota bacterium]
MTEPVALRPSSTALLLVEYQNDFAAEGGSLHTAVSDVMEQTGMLEHSAALVRAARNAGVTIIHAPLAFDPGYEEIAGSAYGILKGVVDSQSFANDTWGVELVDGMTPDPADVVLTDKRSLDAFSTTNLQFVLESRQINTLAIAGFLTNCCIESTMRSAYERGYEVVPVVDCMAATSLEEHEMAVKHNFPRFSRPVDHRQFLDALPVAVGS